MSLAATDLGVALGQRTVLAEVTLALRPGEVTAVLGPNGAGKSTLLRALAGLLPPHQGTVILDGTALGGFDGPDRARAIGFLPQHRTIHWPMTVEHTVELGRVPHGDRSPQAIERAMAEMDVTQFRDRPVTELSGGELARVLMARVLAQDTPILLADEPTAGLDPAHQLALLDCLAARAKAGKTVVVALHDLSLAARYGQRIVLLQAGRITADGVPDAVLTAALLKSTFGIDAQLGHVEGMAVVLPRRVC